MNNLKIGSLYKVTKSFGAIQINEIVILLEINRKSTPIKNRRILRILELIFLTKNEILRVNEKNLKNLKLIQNV